MVFSSKKEISSRKINKNTSERGYRIKTLTINNYYKIDIEQNTLYDIIGIMQIYLLGRKNVKVIEKNLKKKVSRFIIIKIA